MDEQEPTMLPPAEQQTQLTQPNDLALPLEAPTSPTIHDRIHWLIIGPGGLRVPWRLFLYFLMAAATLFLFGIFLNSWEPTARGRIWFGMVSEAGLMIVAIVPAVAMSRLESRTFASYGLPSRLAFGKLFWIGAAWGLVGLTILMLILRAIGVFYFGGVALSGARVLKFAAFYGLFFLIVGFFEEFLARGYTQFTLTQGIGFWPSAAVLSTAFGCIHLGNKGEGWIGALAAGLIGFFFCLTLRRTGNLWFAVGFHASWDWGETYLYSVPNSGTTAPGHLLSSSFHGSRWLTGGTIGPEGSIFLFIVLALLWIAFDRMYPHVNYPPATTAALLEPISIVPSVEQAEPGTANDLPPSTDVPAPRSSYHE